MTQGVRDIVDAIISGDSIAIDDAFNAEMATRISAKLDDMRVEVAQNMFNEAYKCKSKMKKEEVKEELSEEEIIEEMINEVLGKNEPAGAWIKDFVSSDDPKFAGKSKEKRKQMALAAYYAKQRNEELDVNEVLDYLSENEEVLVELSKDTLKSYVDKASDDTISHKIKSAGVKNRLAFGDKETKAKYDLHTRKIANREAGVKTAVQKLAK